MARLGLQSAMEYLMTYGWAILIIAVVLGALFGLGFFNSATLAPKVAAGSCQVYRPNGPGTTSYINLQGVCNNELPQYAAQFNGATSFINISNPASFNLASSYTVTGWFEVTSWASANSQNIFTKDLPAGWNAGPGGKQMYLWPSGSSLRYDAYASCCGSVGTSSATFRQNTWYQFAFASTSGNYLTIYVNGAVANPSASEGGPEVDNPASAIYIGISSPGVDPFWGDMADIQFYNTTLSANEISSLYDEGIGGSPVLINNLVGWWPLNGNADDYSGNLNNGVSSNIVFTSSWTSGYSAP